MAKHTGRMRINESREELGRTQEYSYVAATKTFCKVAIFSRTAPVSFLRIATNVHRADSELKLSILRLPRSFRFYEALNNFKQSRMSWPFQEANREN